MKPLKGNGLILLEFRISNQKKSLALPDDS